MEGKDNIEHVMYAISDAGLAEHYDVQVCLIRDLTEAGKDDIIDIMVEERLRELGYVKAERQTKRKSTSQADLDRLLGSETNRLSD